MGKWTERAFAAVLALGGLLIVIALVGGIIPLSIETWRHVLGSCQ